MACASRKKLRPALYNRNVDLWPSKQELRSGVNMRKSPSPGRFSSSLGKEVPVKHKFGSKNISDSQPPHLNKPQGPCMLNSFGSSSILPTSFPSHGLHTSLETTKPSFLHLKRTPVTKLNRDKSISEEFKISLTPTISTPSSPVKCNSDLKNKCSFDMVTYSLPTKRKQSTRKSFMKVAKRELFQNIHVAISPNKESALVATPSMKADCDIKIFPSDSPQIAHSRILKDMDFPPKEQLILCKTPSKISHREATKIIGCDTVEEVPEFRRNCGGMRWLEGLAWKPKTPVKSSSDSVLRESTCKKRQYFVSGGLAERLQKLELREMSALHLQRHMASLKRTTCSLPVLKVVAVNFSTTAFPITLCQDINTSEEFLYLIPQNQIPNITVGSELKMPKPCLPVTETSKSVLYCAPEDMQVTKTSSSFVINSNILFTWNPPCSRCNMLPCSVTCDMTKTNV